MDCTFYPAVHLGRPDAAEVEIPAQRRLTLSGKAFHTMKISGI